MTLTNLVEISRRHGKYQLWIGAPDTNAGISAWTQQSMASWTILNVGLTMWWTSRTWWWRCYPPRSPAQSNAWFRPLNNGTEQADDERLIIEMTVLAGRIVDMGSEITPTAPACQPACRWELQTFGLRVTVRLWTAKSGHLWSVCIYNHDPLKKMDTILNPQVL